MPPVTTAMNATDTAPHFTNVRERPAASLPAVAGTAHRVETVLSVTHWNDTLFSFTTTRAPSFRFESGHFVMLGLPGGERPLTRAYSLAGPSHAEQLEFFSIKVPGGALTSRLQHLQAGDPVLVGNKPTGTLMLSDLRPGRTLYLLCTGTGLAPFMGIVREPEAYAAFEKIVLVHGVRHTSDLAYRDYIDNELPHDEYFGADVVAKLIYSPTVTRDDFRNRGRITDLIRSGALAARLGLPPLSPQTDRVMVCGGPAMLADTRALLDSLGFDISPGRGRPGAYVVERAFAES